MKPFQTLLLLAVIILIGGMAALYWGKSIQDATVPVEVVEVEETVKDELSPGSYLVFHSVETTDPGTKDWANVDTNMYTFYRLALGEATYRANPSIDHLVAFTQIEHGPEFSGSLTTSVFGQDLLMHRYEFVQGEQYDGLLALDGKIIQTRPEHWGSFRSINGRYEVLFDALYDGEGPNVLVMDLDFRKVTSTFALPEIITDSNSRWQLEPFLIDDTGEYLYVHEVCGCEATLSGTWQVEIATGKVTRLDTLVDLDSWFLSSLDVNGRGLLAISTERGPSNEGPNATLSPPTTIRILDLESLEVGELLVDADRAWDRPWLDPEGNDRYVVRLWGEGNKQYLVNFDDTEIVDANFLTDGWILDWVGDWLVVQNTQDSTLKLVNVETKEEVGLEIPGERVDYVGSIELN